MRRATGTGSIINRGGVYYGQWRNGGKQVMRRLGPVRQPGSRQGLTKTMAEEKLRELRSERVTPVGERVSVGEAGERLLAHLEAMGRKPSTMRSYRANHRNQIEPRLGERPVSKVTQGDVERFIADCVRGGLAPKTVNNCLGLLYGIFELAIKRGWAHENRCKCVEKPKVEEDTDIHFLDQEEVEALLRAAPDTEFGAVQRALYLAAVMTGMRQGELLALRWIDVDWRARRIRVRRNYVRGEFGTPKTRRSSRSIPLADRLGGELDLLYRRSRWTGDEDLVFANPHTGGPLNGCSLLKAFQRALGRAGVRRVRFHDLRHTFGTRMAAAGVPMRTLQEWMGHRDFRTTQIYADYAPSAGEVEAVNLAFGGKTVANEPLDTEVEVPEVSD
jgi:integrase